MPRLLFLFLLLATSVGMTRSEPALRARTGSTTRVDAVPIPLDAAGAGTRVGALRYVSGYALTSADPRFGGISAMVLAPGGFVALSDAGTVMRLSGRADRRPRALRLLPLAAGPGNAAKKSDRDSEAMARDAQGRIWVAFERHNSLWRYAPDFRRAEAHRAPPEMARWKANSGAEAMLRLPDGRFAVWSEGRATQPGASPGTSETLLFDRDPVDPHARAARLAWRLPSGFSVTDAALLGDRRVLTLHRSFSVRDGIAASLGIADLAALRAGATVAPRIVATLRPPLNVDNMEALAVERVGGRTRIWIASDDNFSVLQRTLLMQFELVE